MFWKKKEPVPPMPSPELPSDLGLGKEHDLGLGLGDKNMPDLSSFQDPLSNGPSSGSSMGTMGNISGSSAPQQQFSDDKQQSPSSFSQAKQYSSEKDFQILSAKLDSLKAILDNINQRLTNIERIAQESQEDERYEKY